LYLEDRYPEAVRALEKLLADKLEELDPMLRDRTFLYLVEAYRLSDQPERAVGVLDRQIAELREREGIDAPSALIARLRRIELVMKTEDVSKAEQELKALQPVLDRYYDQASGIQAQFHTIAGQYYNGREPKTSLTHFRQALAANEQALGPEHENTLRSHLNVALVIAYSQPDRSEAYSHFAQAISGIEKVKGLSYSLIGFARLEAAKSYFWDKNHTAAQAMLTPAHAMRYFPEMPEVNRNEYMAALYYGFGLQDCDPGWESQTAAMPQSLRIARAVMCRYDPTAEHRPKD
jgi:tetratricopeptide (TPR) repeat protein